MILDGTFLYAHSDETLLLALFRELTGYERLCSTGEWFVYVAMTRLIVRRVACP
jgi:hypothetical protein